MPSQSQLAAMANVELRREIGKLLSILTLQGQTQTDIELAQLEQAAALAGIMDKLGATAAEGSLLQGIPGITAEGGAANVAGGTED